MAFYSQDDNMELQENLISYVAQSLVEEHEDILDFLKRDKEELKELKPPFKRIDYEKAIEIANNRGAKLNYGDDFGADEEALITEDEKKPIFITNFPIELKAFYMKDNPKKEGTVLAADVLAPKGHGEIIGGSERIADYEILVEKIKRFGLRPEDYYWYIDLRRYGSVPHAGFGLGVDRLVMWICGLDHIRDAIAFPRDIRRVKP
jgi:asparaginyl-tRNA synthetase